MAYKQISPQEVVEGGIGTSSNTAYAVLCGGTTATGAIQSVASVGTSGQVLTSNGAGALPTFQASGGGGGGLTLISSQTASSSSSLDFTSIGSYSAYLLIIDGFRPATNGEKVIMRMSNDNGSSWISSSYQSNIHWAANLSTIFNVNATTYYWYLTGGISNASASYTGNAQVTIFQANAAVNPYVSGTFASWSSAGHLDQGWIGGKGGSTGANAFKIYFPSGNIASGRATLYGFEVS